MFLQNLFRSQKLLGFVLILVFAVVSQSFAATHTDPKSSACDAAGIFCGYSIDTIDYILLPSDPSKVDSLTLRFADTSCSGVVTDVLVSVDAGTNWIACTGKNTITWACNFAALSKPSVLSISKLQFEFKNRISWYEKLVCSIRGFLK